MRYTLFNDVYTFVKKYCKYIIFYYLIVLFFIIINLLMYKQFTNDLFFKSLGVLYSSDMGILDIIIFYFNFSFNLFVVFQIFDNDIKNGICNIFLRMSIKKWLSFKCISLALITLLKNLIFYVILMIISIGFQFNIFSILKQFIISIIFIIFVNLFVLITVTLKKNVRNIILIFISGMILLEIIPFNIYIIDDYWNFIILGIIIQIIYLRLKSKKIVYIIEKGDLK